MLLVLSITFHCHYNICTLSYYHHQIGSMNYYHCLGLDHATMVCAVCLFVFLWGCMCSTDPFQFRWLKECIYYRPCYHHQIGSINLTHCYHIFPGLCAWDVRYIIFCHLLHIHSGKTGILFSSLLCSLWWVQIVGCVLACRSYSFICI